MAVQSWEVVAVVSEDWSVGGTNTREVASVNTELRLGEVPSTNLMVSLRPQGILTQFLLSVLAMPAASEVQLFSRPVLTSLAMLGC